MKSSETARGNRYGLMALAAVLAAVVFGYPLLLDVPLLDPTEGLHASIAQEMSERGQWVLPQLLGEPFLDKPILHFWAEAGSLRLFGMHEAAARLPGMLFGLLAAVATGLLAGRVFDRQLGWIAAILYTTMVLPAALVQFPTTDVVLIPLVILSVWLFWEAEQPGSRRRRLAVIGALGLSLGLCALAKGIVGIVIVGVAYGGYRLLTRRLTLSVCLRAAAALLIAALVASVWFLAVEARVPGYLHYYFIERTLLGYATDSQIHGGEPWWYYLPVLLIGGMPWIGYMPAVWLEQRHHSSVAGAMTADQREQNERRRRAMTLLWCWLIGGVILFSLAGSKLMTYLWPVIPPVAVLAAVAWRGLLAGSLSPRARVSLLSTLRLSCLSGPFVFVGIMYAVGDKLEITLAWPVWVATAVVALSATLPWWLTRVGRMQAGFAAATLSITAQLMLLMTAVVPQAARQHSARALADHFNRQGRVPHRLLLADERVGSLVFYLDADLRARLNAERLGQVSLATLPPLEPGTVVVLSEETAAEAPPELPITALPYGQVGRYRLYEGVALAGTSTGAPVRSGTEPRPADGERPPVLAERPGGTLR